MWDLIGKVNNLIWKITLYTIILPAIALTIVASWDNIWNPQYYEHTEQFMIRSLKDDPYGDTAVYSASNSNGTIEFYSDDIDDANPNTDYTGNVVDITFDGSKHIEKIKIADIREN